MRNRNLLSLLIFFLLTITHSQANWQFTRKPSRTPDGILVYPDDGRSGCLAAVRLSVISDRIIRMLSGPAAIPASPAQNLIIIYAAPYPVI